MTLTRYAKACAPLLATALLAGCQTDGIGGQLGLDIGVGRPDGTRFITHLENTGQMPQLATKYEERAKTTFAGVSFSGQPNFNTQNAPLLAGSRVERDLNTLAKCLLQAWPGEKPNFRVFISSGLTPSAQALPREVSVNVGLLTADQISIGEVTFVLAHEISHILLDHYGRKEFLDEQKNVASKLAQAAVLAAYASEMRVQRSGNSVVFRIDNQDTITQAALYSLAAYQGSQLLADGLIESSWNRTQEYEADRLAADVLERTGLSGEFAYDSFDRLIAWEENRQTRLQAFEKIAEEKMDAAAKEAVEKRNVNVLVQAGAKVFIEGATRGLLDIYERVDTTHPTPQARSDEFAEYQQGLSEAPPVEPSVTCDTSNLERSLKARDLQRARDALEAAFAVDKLLLEGDVQGARDAAKRALRRPVKNHPVTRLAAFRADSQAGRSGPALAHLQAIRINESTPLSVYAVLAGQYLERARYLEARRTLKQGERYFLRDYFLPQYLQVALGQNQIEAAESLRNECRESQVDGVWKACRKVLENRAATSQEVLDSLSPESGGGIAELPDLLGGLLEGL